MSVVSAPQSTIFCCVSLSALGPWLAEAKVSVLGPCQWMQAAWPVSGSWLFLPVCRWITRAHTQAIGLIKREKEKKAGEWGRTKGEVSVKDVQVCSLSSEVTSITSTDPGKYLLQPLAESARLSITLGLTRGITFRGKEPWNKPIFFVKK